MEKRHWPAWIAGCRVFVFWMVLIGIAIPGSFAHSAEDPLIIGVFPRRNAGETAKLFTPMASYLSRQLGREVKLVTSRNFEAFWKDVTQQRFDIVHYNQYHYVRSSKTYKVIAYTQEFGKNTVAGVLFVRKDSGITSVSQLRGRNVIFGGGRDAMLAYIAPRYLMLQAGLKDGDFKSEFAVNPQNALVALYHRQADAAGGGEVVLDQPVVKQAIDTNEVTVLASTERLLFLPWAIRRTLPASQAQAVQSALLNIKNGDDGRQVLKAALMTSIEAAEDKDYDPHRKMANAVFGPRATTK